MLQLLMLQMIVIFTFHHSLRIRAIVKEQGSDTDKSIVSRNQQLKMLNATLE